MKKKLIIGVLALSMCFTFASCDVINDFFGNNRASSSSSSETGYDVAAAAEVLYDTLVDKDEETRVDYTVPNTLTYLNNVYKITWSVNVTEGVELKVGETETTVVVDKNAQANIPYELTAVVADPDGKTETVTFERKVLQAPAYAPEAITAKPVENQAYKLYVYQSTKKIDCYFTGNMKNNYYFGSAENYEEGVDVFVEYVEDSTDLFNLYFNHTTDGKQYIGVVISGTHSNVKFDSNPVSQFSYSTEYKTIITNVEGTDHFLGNYSSYDTIQASKISNYSTSNIGNLVEMIDKNNIAPGKKIAKVKDSLFVQADHRMNKEIELPTYDERFADVTISWALSETTNATLSEDGKLSLTIPTETATVTLTATINCGDKSDTKEFTLNLGPAIVLGETPTAEEIVNAAFSLAEGEALAKEYTLTGKITKINTAYSEQYDNITVTISVADKEIECFRLKGDGIATLKVGDTIEVNGTIKNYNGKVEFDSDCTLKSVSADQGGTDTPADDTAPATQNTADFNTLTVDYQNYAERTTTNGWTATNAQVLTYGTSNNNGEFNMYETEGTNAVCLNGKTDALGTLVSPTFTGGIKKLSFNYGFSYKDTQFSITINVKDTNGTVVATKTLEEKNLTRYRKYEYVWNLETAVESNFTIEIKNNGLSASTKNIDRLSIWNLAWNSVSTSGATIVGGTETPDEGGNDTPTPSLSIVTAPAVGTAYKFAMVQANKNNTVYYLAGGMSSYYLATTDDASKALDFYLETTEGGYYLYCYVGNDKTYVNCTTSNGHVNGAYETTASTVYTIDQTGLLTATINDISYAFGTRNDNTYTTVGPVAKSYNGFHCYFYGAANA